MKRILILNRGEIACRIIHTLKKRGFTSIAVYQEAEANARHIYLADEAYVLPTDYLDVKSIVKMCQDNKVDAVHPGYGFLSENADFARALANENIVFIGPSAEAIKTMGDKVEARKLARKLGIPLMKGADLPAQEKKGEAELKQMAKDIGYPMLLKASAGGGGKAMAIVEDEKVLFSEYERLRAEADTLYHNSALVIERYLAKARHVEVQILGNCKGENFVIFDRDCTMQRNNQKILEEAPALAMNEAVREQMQNHAKLLADEVGYQGAGTVEFLYDNKSEEYFFLEMNTRLQVEHTVTEMITGLDLVAEQCKIAQGQFTSYENLESRGHAIEARVCAEMPDQSFTPQAGKIVYFETPKADSLTRIDTGVEAGSEILPLYDNMISKVIVWGETRAEAIENLQAALKQTHILGVHTNIPLVLQLLATKEFATFAHYTRFISQAKIAAGPGPEEVASVAGVCYYQYQWQQTAIQQKKKTGFSNLAGSLAVFS